MPQPVQCPPGDVTLLGRYQGLAQGVRCQAELEARMQYVARALGVSCSYCHAARPFADASKSAEPVLDYTLPTERKRIANWMALELVPRLREKSTGHEVSCASCHAPDGTGRAKLLGHPRSQETALEWMNTHMVSEFVTQSGAPLRCKTCHSDQFGSPGFERRLLLTPSLSAMPRSPAL